MLYFIYSRIIKRKGFLGGSFIFFMELVGWNFASFGFLEFYAYVAYFLADIFVVRRYRF